MKLSRNNNQKKKIKLDPKFWVRVMAMFLCVLMLLGAAAALFPFLGFASYAQDDLSGSTNFTENENIRVGLMYGTGVTVGFEVRADYGMDLVSINEMNEYTKIRQITTFGKNGNNQTLVCVTCDANLSKSDMTYSLSGTSDADIGGFHIQLNSSEQSLDADLEWVKKNASAYGYTAFPAYILGQYVIRIGAFTSYDSAVSALNTLSSVFSGITAVSPTATSVSLINPLTDEIIFEYDGNGETQFGLRAVQQNLTERSYLITPAKNKYDGTFEFSRYTDGTTEGVELVNILSIEEYILGVLPWEISNSWPIEVQKAFAVTVRTFAASMKGRHELSYGFDLCNSTHCQAYMGVGRVNDAVRKAVSETAATVLTYNGKPATTYYSAVTGGVTVSAIEAWGGSEDKNLPYLQAVATPWENYAEHQNGLWTVEVTPKKLLDILVAKGYTNLTGSIADVKIDSFAKNSTYVYSITFTDTSGSRATITSSDKIRTVLSSFLKSANFVVGKVGDTLTVTDYTLASDKPIQPPKITPENGDTNNGSSENGAMIITSHGVSEMLPGETISVAKAVGTENISDLSKIFVISSEGKQLYDMTSEIYSDNIGGGVNSAEDVTTANVNSLPNLSNILGLQTIAKTRTMTAQGTAGNFVFIGRGWGHGVGLSQYGAKNLAELGYGYEAILKAYFPGTVLSNIKSVEK